MRRLSGSLGGLLLVVILTSGIGCFRPQKWYSLGVHNNCNEQISVRVRPSTDKSGKADENFIREYDLDPGHTREDSLWGVGPGTQITVTGRGASRLERAWFADEFPKTLQNKQRDSGHAVVEVYPNRLEMGAETAWEHMNATGEGFAEIFWSCCTFVLLTFVFLLALKIRNEKRNRLPSAP